MSLEDLVSVGRVTGARKKSKGKVDIITMDDDAEALEGLLIFLHPRHGNPAIEEAAELEKCVPAASLITRCPS